MNKKKIAALIVAGIMTVGVVGGTLAWFTSEDSVTNVFNTGAVNEDGGNGVEIWEDYTPATSVVPGETTTKLVQVQNTTNYDSFIRVKFDLSWDKDGLLTEKIELNFGDNIIGIDNTWIYDKSEGYYYYVGKVAGNKYTNPLLESVTLSSSAGNEYKNAKYNVKVIAESIQADNNAIDSWKTTDNTNIITALKSLEGSTGNANAEYGATKTDTATRE